MSETHDIAIGERMVSFGNFKLEMGAKHFTELQAAFAVERNVVLHKACTNSELIEYPLCTENMVEMAVCEQGIAECQPVVDNILPNGGTFLFCQGSTVDDDCLFRGIVNHIGIFLKGIVGESLDM